MCEPDWGAFEAAVAREIVPPSFDALVANASRRRRNAYAATAVAAAGAVAVSVTVANVGGATRHEPAPPVTSTNVPTPTHGTSTAAARLTPEQIVTDQDAVLDQFAVSPSDSDVRAAVWRLCDGRRCRTSQLALALTDDGFQTAAYLPLRDTAYVTALPDGEFFAGAGRQLEVVTPGGSAREVSKVDDASPALPGDTLIPSLGLGGRAYALDPHTAVAHRIPLPAPADHYTVSQLDDGRLLAVMEANPNSTAAVSTDGGATWQSASLDTPRSALLWPAYSASDTLGVAEGSDGATLFPLNAVWRSTDGGLAWQRHTPVLGGVTADQAYLGGLAVEPDGTLVVCVDAWSDERRGQPSRHPYGLYVSDGDDWSRLSAAPLLGPADGDSGASVSIVDTGDGGQRIYVEASLDQVFATDDGGDSWTEVSAR